MVSMPVALFLPAFYTQELGLGMAAVEFILMMARFWDVVTDPIIGYLGDRTSTPIGRRKPWIIVAVPMMMASVYFLFMPPEGIGSGYLLGWIMLLWLGWTLFNIPYYAWGAELSTDYTERTRITGWRTILGLVGTVIAVTLPAGSQWLFDYGGKSGEALTLIGLAVLVMLPLCVAIPILTTKERDNFVPSKIDILPGLKIMWSNAPFRRLVLAFVFSSLAVALTAPLFVLFINHIVGDATAAPRIVLGYYVTNMLGVPFWMWLAEKTDKHISWLISLGLMAVTFPCFLLLGEGDVWQAAALLCLVGIGGGNFNVVPASMKADVIDLDTLESGDDRAGLFFAAWSTATKMVHALGVGIALPVLAWFGFDPTIKNPPEQLFALQAFYSLAPIAFYALAAVLLIRYPITRAKHTEITLRLRERAQTQTHA